MKDFITIETYIDAPMKKVWEAFTSPDDVQKWNNASADWHTTKAENDLKVGGKFSYRMEAKDGSEGFDFWGIYDELIDGDRIAYTMGDGRKVEVDFVPEGEGVRIIERFEPESQNSREMQQAGWQSILENFKNYVETDK